MTKVYFATNRNLRPNRPKNPFGKRLSTPPSSIRFGSATVQEGRVTVEVAPEKMVPRPGRLTQDERSILGSKKVFGEMRQEMAEDRQDALIYIHGAKTKFKRSVRLSARFEAALGDEGPNVAVFSWPSNGTMLPWWSYSSDRHDSRISGIAVGRLLLKLVDFLRATAPDSCKQQVHLLAHSMGVYAMRYALQRVLAEWPRRLPRVFGQVILVAADEDEDAFEHDYKLRRLPELAQGVHVYFNRQDSVLAASDRTKPGNQRRLGDSGVRYSSDIPSGMTQIDCTPVVHGGLFEHGYHQDCPAVLADVRAVLSGADPDEIPNRQCIEPCKSYRLVGPTARGRSAHAGQTRG